MIRLSKSRIPADKLNHPKLPDFEKRANSHIQSESNQLATCLHEAAHTIYMERARIKKYRFFGPAIVYLPEADDFALAGASVKMMEIPELLPGETMEHSIRKIARFLAAGAVAQRVLLDDFSRPSDYQDYQNFVEVCRVGQPTWNDDQILEEWESGKRDVELDFRDDPSLEEKVRKRAIELSERLLNGDYE